MRSVQDGGCDAGERWPRPRPGEGAGAAAPGSGGAETGPHRIRFFERAGELLLRIWVVGSRTRLPSGFQRSPGLGCEHISAWTAR